MKWSFSHNSFLESWFKLGPDSMETVTSPSRKITVRLGEVIAQNYGIFCQFRSKLAITHTNTIKWKEKYDALVVNCHRILHLCGDTMKMSLPKKIFF